MNRRDFLLSATCAAAVPLAIAPARGAALPKAKVYRSAGCNCCIAWARHMQRAGFAVELHTVEDIVAHKNRGAVPENLYSCHTAFVGDYVVEGHVPPKDVLRLLAEKPKAKGLAVPGMPVGSPGMEMGNRVDPYRVILFGPNGQRTYAKHGTQ